MAHISIFAIIGLIVCIAIIVGYGVIIWRRKSKWYVLHILGDYTNPHQHQAIFLMGEQFDKGVLTGRVYKHYWSWFTVFVINSIPDLQSYCFGQHLFAYRGVTGLAGDINYTFVMPPIIAKPSADKLVDKLTTDLQGAVSAALKGLTPEERVDIDKNPAAFDELILKQINTEWVQKNIGLITLKKEDVLLREDRVVHAAINADSADFAKNHMDNWQKLAAMLYPITVIIILIGFSIGAYILYQSITTNNQMAFADQKFMLDQLNSRINETNYYNQWLYQDLKAIQVYGVQVPKNLTLVRMPTNSSGQGGSLLPTSVPSIPSSPS